MRLLLLLWRQHAVADNNTFLLYYYLLVIGCWGQSITSTLTAFLSAQCNHIYTHTLRTIDVLFTLPFLDAKVFSFFLVFLVFFSLAEKTPKVRYLAISCFWEVSDSNNLTKYRNQWINRKQWVSPQTSRNAWFRFQHQFRFTRFCTIQLNSFSSIPFSLWLPTHGHPSVRTVCSSCEHFPATCRASGTNSQIK